MSLIVMMAVVLGMSGSAFAVSDHVFKGPDNALKHHFKLEGLSYPGGLANARNLYFNRAIESDAELTSKGFRRVELNK